MFIRLSKISGDLLLASFYFLFPKSELVLP